MMYMGAEVHSVGRMSEPPTIDQPPRREFPEARYPMQELTGRIIAASFVVHGEFGFGFLESVYRRALAVELRHQGVPLAQEVPYELFHRGVHVGLYRADLVVDSQVIVEAKRGLRLDPTAPAQALNCLRASGLSLGLVIHFGTNVNIRRVIGVRR